MTSISIAAARPKRLTTVVGVVGFAAALALASQVAVPLPFTPVPITLQPLVVVLAGLWLGPVAGAASMVLYLLVGATGVPVFSPFGAPGIARFVGPTGGYLIAYPFGAFVAGWISSRWPAVAGRFVAASLGIAVVLIGGLAQLAILNRSLTAAIALGIHPFVLLDFVKALVAALISPRRLRQSA
jgi:biotin transport system substrate-specific component